MNERLDLKGREIRGIAIISKGDQPQTVGQSTYRVPSQSGNGAYLVTLRKKYMHCSCPDYQQRKVICKHLHAIMFWEKFKKKVESREEIEIPEPTEEQQCIRCNSFKISKFGKVKGTDKQRYRCKECEKTFIADNDFKKFKGDAKMVTAVIDLHFKGCSLRQIQDHVKQFYGLKISHVTAYNWIKRFTKIMNAYTDSIKPSVSGLWNIDEQAIKSKGKKTWCWNVIDNETRFLIANNVTRERSIAEAREIMVKARNVKDNPHTIVTDGLWSYEQAVRKELLTAEHHRFAGITKDVNNNRVERFHNTFRARDKSMRGFKSIKTAQEWSEGFKLYYNFIRPHMAFDGLTPSQVAGIKMDLGTNRWEGLLRRSLEMDKSINVRLNT